MKGINCNNQRPTPYLRKYIDCIGEELELRRNSLILDIGCGNGRNLRPFMERGCINLVSIDKYNAAADFKLDLEKDELPVETSTVALVLCQYVCMFLSSESNRRLWEEILRVSAPRAAVVMEFYPAKTSFSNDDEKCGQLANDCSMFFEKNGWRRSYYQDAYHFTLFNSE